MAIRPVASRLVAGTFGVLVLMAASSAHAAWPTAPTLNVPVSVLPEHSAFGCVTAPDSCGGVIAAWLDIAGATFTIYTHRVDVSGQPRWALNGFPIAPPLSYASTTLLGIAPDGAGGAYVTWSDRRVAVNGFDIFVQHVLAAGAVDPAWPVGGVPVCAAPGDQENPSIAADGFGGALVVWEDARGGADFSPDLYAQRIGFSGAVSWSADGVPVIAARGSQFSQAIAADGAGGLFVAWQDFSSGSSDVFAQHLDPLAGAPTWPSGGLAICTAPDTQYQLQVAAELGRMLVVWTDHRTPPEQHIYAQAVSPTGVVLWTPDGVQVSAGPYTNNSTARIVPDGTGGAIVGWEAFDVAGLNDDIVAQRLDPAGNLMWVPDPLVVCGAPDRQMDLFGISDQQGGAVFAWRDDRVPGPTTAIYAQRVSGSGAMLWTPDGAAVSTGPNFRYEPVAVTDGAGGAVLVWIDARFTPDNAVYAQQIGAGGLLGVRAASRNCAPDRCGFAYTDFGDAPEMIPAYPSGAPGHFPTCTADTDPGTQEIGCGAALSTPPGPTGYVEHVASWSDPEYFGLGCGPGNAPGLAVDTELDGVVKAGVLPASIPSETSTCSPAVAIFGYEWATGGPWYAADERAGDLDAGLGQPLTLSACQQGSFAYDAWSCGADLRTAYLNVLVDWSQDGDWNDVVSCAGSRDPCTPEWAVKNAAVSLASGCNHLSTPAFRAGPNAGGAWMRMTLTADPVSDDFPWLGSAPPSRSGGTGYFAGGETEDYPVAINATTGVGERTEVVDLQLAPPAPNPSSGVTLLRFSLPRAAHAELGVFDLAGRRVRALTDATLPAGEHATSWNGRDAGGAPVSAGLYYVRLRVDGATRSRCVVLSR